jgi:hypothetical protein
MSWRYGDWPRPEDNALIRQRFENGSRRMISSAVAGNGQVSGLPDESAFAPAFRGGVY